MRMSGAGERPGGGGGEDRDLDAEMTKESLEESNQTLTDDR